MTLKRSNGSHYCGGSVINTNKVMSAAHCKQSTNDFTAGAGSITLTKQTQVRNGRSQAAHPQFNSFTLDYDYMVITISGIFAFDGLVMPIPIVNPTQVELIALTPLEASGYGYFQLDANDNPVNVAQTLQYMAIDSMTRSSCKMYWPTVSRRNQCAYTLGVTTCQGDSGGPLTVLEDNVTKLLGKYTGHSPL